MTAPAIDTQTGEPIRIKLDVHQCYEKDYQFMKGIGRQETDVDEEFDQSIQDRDMFCVSGMEEVTPNSGVSDKIFLTGKRCEGPTCAP